MWLGEWAFATSPAPYGLGMRSAEYWGLTPREFDARGRVREAYMAVWRSETRNAPHFSRKDKKPWMLADFMAGAPKITGDPLRDRLAQIEAQSDAIAVFKAKLELSQAHKGEPPDWLKTPYIPKAQRKDPCSLI